MAPSASKLASWFANTALVLLGLSMCKRVTDTLPAHGAAGRRPAPVLAVQTSTLLAAYELDEAAADEAFKGEILAISGEIDSIGRDYIVLRTGERFADAGVQAYFEAGAEEPLARLGRGQAVVVRCRCDGKFDNVMLRACRLE